MKIKNILVATDGSRGAGKAVKYAAGLARQLGAVVTVLQVVDVTALAAPGVNPLVSAAKIAMDVRDILARAADRNVATTAAQVRKQGPRARTSVRSGVPVEEIVSEAKRQKADLIVLGSQGRSAFKAAMLGSVAYGVIHRSSKIPVLVVR
jgi:nucleotide-binding universal stress UspA family protein